MNTPLIDQRPPMPGPAPGAPDGWSTEIWTDKVGFAGLHTDWNELYARCPDAAPFQCYAWLASWWRHYGTPGRLRLILVRRHGHLVAAAPLMLDRRGPWRVLTPLGGAISDFTDILIDPAHTPDAAQVLGQALLTLPGWQVLDLPEARPAGTSSRHLYPAWPGPRRRLAGSTCLELPARPMDELLAGLPGRTARLVRKRRTKIDAVGLTARTVPAEECEQAIAAMLHLHEQQWRGRGITAEHLRPRFARHLTEAVENMIGDGQATLTEYRDGDQLVVCDLTLIGNDLVGGYLGAIHPDIRDKIDVAVLLMDANLTQAHTLGRPTLSMLRGEEPYKTRWRPTSARNQRILLAKPGHPLARPYLTAVRSRAVAADTAKQRLPWLRTLHRRARQIAVPTTNRRR